MFSPEFLNDALYDACPFPFYALYDACPFPFFLFPFVRLKPRADTRSARQPREGLSNSCLAVSPQPCMHLPGAYGSPAHNVVVGRLAHNVVANDNNNCLMTKGTQSALEPN